MDPAAADPADEAGEAEEAFARAVRSIGRRERTVAQVRELLVSKGFRETAVEDALSRLVEIGALDDARYARLFSEDKRELEGWGPERIRATLADHGVSWAVIAASVAEEPRADQLDRATLLLAEREPIDSDAARGRALGFLARRGFDSELCYAAVRRASCGPEAA